MGGGLTLPDKVIIFGQSGECCRDLHCLPLFKR